LSSGGLVWQRLTGNRFLKRCFAVAGLLRGKFVVGNVLAQQLSPPEVTRCAALLLIEGHPGFFQTVLGSVPSLGPVWTFGLREFSYCLLL